MNNKGYKEIILNLRSQGLSYSQISKKTGFSKALISYHCGKGVKEKHQTRQKIRRKKDPLHNRYHKFARKKPKNADRNNSTQKLNRFLQSKIGNFSKNGRYTRVKPLFSLDDLKRKIGDDPRCYLTGRKIDLSQSRTYELDHIVPASKGGDNSLENCGLACKEANQAKSDLTLDEFYNLCEEIIKHKNAGRDSL